MTPEVRRLWERAAARESRTLSNMFEVLVQRYCDDAGITTDHIATHPAKAAPETSKK